MKKLLLILLCLPLMTLAQQTYVPDDNFEQALISLGYDIVLDDYVTTASIDTVTYLDLSNNLNGLNIADLTGIEDFTSLAIFRCDNNQLTTLDVSQNTALTNLNCSHNNLTTLDVSQNTALDRLDCAGDQLTSLDVSNNTALTYLNCGDYMGGNQLTSLDVSQNTALDRLTCVNNQLTSLDVSQNTALTFLECSNNLLTTLDVSNNTALGWLLVEENQLICLDISQNTNLVNLQCYLNLLEQLNTKNGNWNNMIVVALNNNLTCVEVDNIGTATNNWQFDNFTSISTNCNYVNPCWTTSAIQEHSTNKELLRTTDLLGRETKGTNQPLFYIYDDGTVEKRIVIE